MISDLQLSCSCGAMRGLALHVSSTPGNRVICYCDDCQTYAHFLGRAGELLDAHGGTEIVPVTPAQLKLTEGLARLRCMRLAPNGLLRWYAGCCKTPIANVQARPSLPYAGLVHSFIPLVNPAARDTILGPVRGGLQGRYAIGTPPPGTHPGTSPSLIFRTLGFLLRGALQRQQRPTPFFTADGKPVVEPQILSPDERAALRKLCGPKPA